LKAHRKVAENAKKKPENKKGIPLRPLRLRGEYKIKLKAGSGTINGL
jgi:hypothetical protein